MKSTMRSIVLLVLALPFQAQSGGLDTRGVGLLEHGQTMGCTATLIAPDLVLTAAHCLQGKTGDSQVSAEHIRFHPSTITGQSGEGFLGKKFAIHPVFSLPGLAQERRVSRDIAILQLVRPVPAALATPLRTGHLGELDGKGFVISFRGATSRARHRACVPISQENGLLKLACEVVQGNSGSPYLAVTDTGLSIVGVISASAKSGRQPIALAADLRAGLGGLLEAFESKE